jgi:hypothetical protein
MATPPPELRNRLTSTIKFFKPFNKPPTVVLAPGSAYVALQPGTKWHMVLAPGFAYMALQPGTKWHVGGRTLLSDPFGLQKPNRSPSYLPLHPSISCSPATQTTRPWSGGSSPEKIEDFWQVKVSPPVFLVPLISPILYADLMGTVG